jgi:hypothetical protein|tara:strand:- start:669 stop:911 length:243 start_codon:yes stop_codon:yes gene_type:complete
LEYLGTGGELFVGFLIAIVILVPFGAVYSLLQFLMVGMEGPGANHHPGYLLHNHRIPDSHRNLPYAALQTDPYNLARCPL